MNRNEKIFNVPEGYFEQLQTRLQAIPSQQTAQKPAETHKVVAAPFLKRVAPYAAAAACLLGAFFVGNHFIGSVQPQTGELSAQDFYYADIIPVTDPYAIFAEMDDYSAAQQVSNEDVIEYLLSSGTSVDYIAYLLNE